MPDAMTPQAVVDALAAMTKPCPNYTDPQTREHWPSCPACNGTGTVALHPWLSEECVGHWTHQETGEHIGPTMDYLQPWRGLKENHGKSVSYIQRHGTWCCQGSGQRVRRGETVHLEEVLVGIKAANWCYIIRSFPQGSSVTDAPPEVDVYHVGAGSKESHCVVSGEDVVAAALRALYAAEAGT